MRSMAVRRPTPSRGARASLSNLVVERPAELEIDWREALAGAGWVSDFETPASGRNVRGDQRLRPDAMEAATRDTNAHCLTDAVRRARTPSERAKS
jgi:hypothetical protein